MLTILCEEAIGCILEKDLPRGERVNSFPFVLFAKQGVLSLG